jgi:F-type H+-transporting ATPase subunit b
MLIDWFTVGAQALNFLILVWLMKHFLYHPILNAIDAREKKVAAELADAAAKKAEAAKDRDDFQTKNQAFDQQRAALLAKATEEAKAERARLLDDARKAAADLRAKGQETLRTDARNLNQAIARRTQFEVFAIARQALTDLATTSLEERMGAVFTRRLREMDGAAKAIMATALKSLGEAAVVRSAFVLPPEERAKLQNAINETFSVAAQLRFEATPDLIGGIELTANGQKVGWSIGDYLKSLEKGVEEILKQQEKLAPKPEARPAAKPETNAEAATPAKSPPEVKVEPKPATESAPQPEPDAKLNSKGEPEPAVATQPAAEPKTSPKIETVVNNAPAASKIEPVPQAKAEPSPEAEATAGANTAKPATTLAGS